MSRIDSEDAYFAIILVAIGAFVVLSIWLSPRYIPLEQPSDESEAVIVEESPASDEGEFK